MAEKRWISETLFDELGFRMTYAVERGALRAADRAPASRAVRAPVLRQDADARRRHPGHHEDEFIYHEMMTHVPILAHGKARDVLIVGGGDCGIAEEVLKHKSVKRLTQVEIDASVVEFAKEHFPEFTGPVLRRQALRERDRRRHELCRRDRTALRRHHRRLDRSAGAGRGAVHARSSIAGCKRCLKPGGVLVTQNGVPMLQTGELNSMSPIPPAVRRRHLLRRGHPDLCRRPHGDGLCQRQQALRQHRRNHRGALPQGRQLQDPILDAGGARRRFRAAAFHCRTGGERKAAALTAPSFFTLKQS